MWCDDGGLVFHEASLDDLNEVAKSFLKTSKDLKIWVFRGEMGSGKTTFIKALGRALGVGDAISSPTFSIVNEYESHHHKIFHFDFYRIRNEAEAIEIGADEYFYSGNYCFIEWPERIPSLIPSERVEINIVPDNQTLRTLAISLHDGKEENGI